MLYWSRAVALGLILALAHFCTGCGSNNAGKIEGKWKIASGPGLTDGELQALEWLKATPYMEFKADGTVVSGLDARPDVIRSMEKHRKNLTQTQTGTYKLLSGNNVQLAGIGEVKGPSDGTAKAGRVAVVIGGDSMTLTAADGTLQLTRMK